MGVDGACYVKFGDNADPEWVYLATLDVAVGDYIITAATEDGGAVVIANRTPKERTDG